jgi:hypothetical protein
MVNYSVCVEQCDRAATSEVHGDGRYTGYLQCILTHDKEMPAAWTVVRFYRYGAENVA